MDRTESIQDKLHQLNTVFNAKTNKYYTANTDSLESKLEYLKQQHRSLRKKIDMTINKNKQDVQDILKQTNQLYEKVDQTNRNFQQQAQLQVSRLRDIEDKFLRKVQLEILERKERQNAIIEAFQHKANNLRAEIQKQQKNRQNLLHQTSSTLQNDLPSIMSSLWQQKQAFTAQYQQVEQESNQLIEESQKNMKEYIMQQENNSTKIFELIRDLTKKIKIEIQQEKNMCESTHEQVFAYIEDSCAKLVQM